MKPELGNDCQKVYVFSRFEWLAPFRAKQRRSMRRCYERGEQSYDDVTGAGRQSEESRYVSGGIQDQENASEHAIDLYAYEPLIWYCLDKAPQKSPAQKENNAERDRCKKRILDRRRFQ